MDLQNLAGDVWQRIVPGPAPEPGRWILVAVLVALLVVVLPPLWRYARLAVTIVHELGHAAVGIAVGRRFTGFVEIGRASCRGRVEMAVGVAVVKRSVTEE